MHTAHSGKKKKRMLAVALTHSLTRLALRQLLTRTLTHEFRTTKLSCYALEKICKLFLLHVRHKLFMTKWHVSLRKHHQPAAFLSPSSTPSLPHPAITVAQPSATAPASCFTRREHQHTHTAALERSSVCIYAWRAAANGLSPCCVAYYPFSCFYALLYNSYQRVFAMAAHVIVVVAGTLSGASRVSS